MTTLPPSGMIYGVQADTLAAYVAEERAKDRKIIVMLVEALTNLLSEIEDVNELECIGTIKDAALELAHDALDAEKETHAHLD